MRTRHLFFITLLSGSVMTATGQSFLNKALNKVNQAAGKVSKSIDQGISAVTGEKPASAPESLQTSASAVEHQEGSISVKVKTDLEKNNLKGRVKAITEKTGTVTTTSTYNAGGMLLKLQRSGEGSVECRYNEAGLIWQRKITVNGGEYATINFDGESYHSEDRSYFYDDAWRLVSNAAGDEGVSYEYNDKGQLVEKLIGIPDESSTTMIYTYYPNGNLQAEHMNEISEYPRRAFKYDDKNRIIRERSADGIEYKYQYNDNNDVVKAEFINFDGENTTYIYIYKYDARNNWIERIWKQGGEIIEKTTRIIEYYPD